MHIKELDKYIDRKHFLMKRIGTDLPENPEAELAEIEEINKKVASVTQKILAQESEKLKTQIKEGTKKIFSDGNFKRTVAKVLIDFLERLYEPSEIKGIMRQGYKIMRRR